ncbi:MAG: aldo/keto reductase [Candidatus Aminicenantia bacterium]
MIKRRDFLAFSIGAIGLTFGKRGEPGRPEKESEIPRIRKYNPLGNTGLKISDVSCGAISLFDPNVLRYAYELGVNYFDTAESYLRMKGEVFVGQGLKDVRDKVIICTKHAYNPSGKFEKEKIIHRVEASLKRLQTDYVDFAFIHNVDNLEPFIKNEEFLSAYETLKKDGKVRFTGFSTHNAKLTLKQALESDFAQAVLVIYNHMEGKDIEPLIEQVRKREIGVIAMKIFAGGMQGSLRALVNERQSYPQAAIRWVLSNPNIDTCIPTMSSYSHVEEYVSASGKLLTKKDLEIIKNYQAQANSLYCRVSCRECLSSCPEGVAINEILRFAMYFENYRMEKEAMQYFSELENSRKPYKCLSCKGYCEGACPYGINIRERLINTHEMLSA